MAQEEDGSTWTIMLYLSGDNNLSPEMVRALTDIKRQVPKGVTFTIQYDPRAPGFKTFRYCIDPEADTATLERNRRRNEAAGPLPIPEYLRERLENENSADPTVLARFVRWSIKQNPKATNRMLILSGHGSGAVGDFLVDNNGAGGRSTSLTIPDLARALRYAEKGAPKARRKAASVKLTAREAEQRRREARLVSTALKASTLNSDGNGRRLIHVLGMDSCLMGMAEVAYEVRSSVRYLVGSEGFLPNTGWPYAHLLGKLAAKETPERTSEKLAGALVKDTIDYYQQYIPAGTSLDMAACDLDGLDRVATAVRKLAAALKVLSRCKEETAKEKDEERDPFPRILRDVVIAAHWRAQSYKFEQYTDLWDFCDQLERGAVRSKALLRRGNGSAQGVLIRIENACIAVKRAVERMTRPGDKPPMHSGPEFQHSHGLAMFFPWSTSVVGGAKALKSYDKLRFSKATGWSRFLGTYLQKTEREGRRGDGRLLRGTQRAIAVPNEPDGVRHSEGISKHSEGVSKHSDTVSKFADIIMTLAPGTTTLPWSMKNPPQGVRWRQPPEGP